MSILFHNFVTKNIYYSKRFLNQHKQFPKSFKNFQFKPTTFQEKTYFTTMSEGKKKSANSFDEIDNNDGAFKRKPTSFHDEIKVGSKYPPAKGRYQLYVCLACPWASRCLAVLALKGIERDVIDVAVTWPIFDVVNEKEGTKSWVFKPKGTTYDGVPVHDPLYGFKSLRELYEKNDSEYTGKYTVPILWDKETESIVNNESSEILRLFNDQFNEWAKNPSVDVSPKDKLKEIDAINDSFYNTLNNGVYRAGFAQKQEAYDEAYNDVFNTLDALEEKLNKSRFLLGKDEPLTECDIRLFVTIIRFDAVYQFHFKCNKRPISSYPNIYNWMRDVYQTPGIADTVQMKHIKDHYFKSHASVNPSFIVPNGPDLESFNAPHDRNTRKYD